MQNQLIKHLPLWEFAKTDNERKVAISVAGVKISQLQNLSSLLRSVSMWRMYLGIPKEDVSEELTIVTDFIAKNFSFLTVAEVDAAYDMFIMEAFECKYHGNFSVLYVSCVLKAYMKYRNDILKEVLVRQEKDIRDKGLHKPTPLEKMESTKETFSIFYKQYVDTGEINDVFNLCYKFLRKHILDASSESDKESAMLWSEKKVKTMDYNLLRELDKKSEIRRWAKNWRVQKYFSENTLPDILDKITEGQFLT